LLTFIREARQLRGQNLAVAGINAKTQTGARLRRQVRMQLHFEKLIAHGHGAFCQIPDVTDLLDFAGDCVDLRCPDIVIHRDDVLRPDRDRDGAAVFNPFCRMTDDQSDIRFDCRSISYAMLFRVAYAPAQQVGSTKRSRGDL
jgi:hypothetical protein